MNRRADPQRGPTGFATLLVSAALLVGACTSTSEVAAPPLTADEFARQGNAICDRLGDELAEVRQAHTDDAGVLSIEGILALREVRAARLNEVFALQPPADLEADLAELQAIGEEWVEVLTSRIPEPDLDLRLGPQWDDAATRLGLTACL